MQTWTTVRSVLRFVIPLVGIVIVFAAVLLVPTLGMQLLLVAVGILVIEAGVWGLASPFLPSDRRHDALRAEVDRFLRLVRQLHQVALAARESDSVESRNVVNEARADLLRSAEQIAAMASAPEGVAPRRRSAHR